jgi:hypothetical protein
MLTAGGEGLGLRIPREAKDMAAADPGQPAGPSDQQEAQDVRVGAFAGPAPGVAMVSS